ncbi:MAG: bifunctional precorrin-2 dehydrogenase/sirohydrochlorin ferrochelatase [Chitinophagales bacterium]|nr:bifunctional precorrin-2 dehydrogenase/sirohydrochlorin ferrochelatase [Chitinophagales bacterium]
MNTLYPIFIKTENIRILVVGGGSVALEKLSFLLKSSPQANITIVAKTISDDILSLIKNKDKVKSNIKQFEVSDIIQYQLIIAATNDTVVNQTIYQAAKQNNILVNVADTPALCDFYLGGIVTKGDLKLAISTNGKSPTMAKQLRQFFEAIIPEEIDDLLQNMNAYRKTLQSDFKTKVETLNDLTKSILNKND